MKHRINLSGKNINCVLCGLNMGRKVTTDCYGKPIRADNALHVYEGLLDFSEKKGWHRINLDVPINIFKDTQRKLDLYDLFNAAHDRNNQDKAAEICDQFIEILEALGLSVSEETVEVSNTCTSDEIAFLMVLQHDQEAWTDENIMASDGATEVANSLLDKKLIMRDDGRAVLTQKGSSYLDEILAVTFE
jgi:mevalonate kinase